MIKCLERDGTELEVVDALKVVFAVFVVGIHTGLLNSLDDFSQWMLMHLLFRLAVPFFMVTSGYFLGKKIFKDGKIHLEVIAPWIKRLMPSFLFWSCFGLLIYTVKLILSHNYSAFGVIVRVVRTTIFYPMGAMWFVGAMILSAIIIYRLLKLKKGEMIIWLWAVIGYIFALLANTYFFLIENTVWGTLVTYYLKVCISARNGAFEGIIFLCFGIVLSRVDLKVISKSKLWGVFLLSVLFFSVEVIGTYGKHVLDDSSLFISFPILIPSMLALAAVYTINLPLPYRAMRRLSTCIYYSHPGFNAVLPGIVLAEGVYRFLIIFVCTILFFCMTSRNKKFNRYLLP